jgi:hypothetical protein
MNSVTAELTYLSSCNSDVTNLLCGMAIKAVVAYVNDYMMKLGLKTYNVFEVVKIILDKNLEMIGGDCSRREKVRKIFTQVVNFLTVKLEIGRPMVCLYMLRNPNYYINHIFVPFYWCAYIETVLNAWDLEDGSGKIPELNDIKDKVILNNNRGQIIGLSKVGDYMYRPLTYEEESPMIGYSFQKRQKTKVKKKQRRKTRKMSLPILMTS